MNIVYSPSVKQYLKRTITILYVKEYFSYAENAKEYVKNLITDIEASIPILQHKTPTQSPLKGVKNIKYITINKGNRTTWYVYFTVHGLNRDIIIVHYISNNHVSGHRVRGRK